MPISPPAPGRFSTTTETPSAGPSFSLRVLTPAFEDGMRLLAENELHPAFPPDAFTVVRSQLAQGVAGQMRTPDYLVRRALRRAILPEGDPSLRQPTPETLMALSQDDLRAYYQATFRPDLTTIVIVGDVTPEQARRVVGDTWRTNACNSSHSDLSQSATSAKCRRSAA